MKNTYGVFSNISDNCIIKIFKKTGFVVMLRFILEEGILGGLLEIWNLRRLRINTLVVLLYTALSSAQAFDSRLDPHISKFENLSKIKVTTDISIGYIKDHGMVIKSASGICDRIQNKAILNVLRWDEFSYIYKEFLVFHELGHCMLKRGHPDHQRGYFVPKFLRSGMCPASIMESGTTMRKMTDECYLRYNKYYIMELFNGK